MNKQDNDQSIEERDDAQREAGKQAAHEEMLRIKTLMSTPKGRAVAYSILDRASVFHGCFNTNALIMARNEGRREIGLWMLDLITTYCKSEYHLMMKEAKHV